MQVTKDKGRICLIMIPRKLGAKNPDKFKIDNFNFEKILDTVSNASDKIANVAGKVVNTTTTVRNIATGVRNELGQVRVIPPTQTTYVQPTTLQAGGFSLNINPMYILAGVIVLIAGFIALRKS